MIRILSLLSLLALTACGTAEPPPREALNVTCEPGGRHGPTGVMDWTCTDGDGEQRLPVRSLHEVIEGAPIETGASSGA
jgi:hypothetical protein